VRFLESRPPVHLRGARSSVLPETYRIDRTGQGQAGSAKAGLGRAAEAELRAGVQPVTPIPTGFVPG
jgi:hypothetical protein